ncbi:MAG: hypothetical protein JWO06_26 [Bacteroidota bacterium]|nr:hypothetical protein [Bacteroidota bacterium]
MDLYIYSGMKNPKAGILLLVILSAANLSAQDTLSGKHYSYVLLREASNSNAPNFSKYKAAFEDGLKNLFAEDSLEVLKNQKEITAKGLKECDILTCTYTLGYSNGLMFNAKITAALRLADCHKKELFTGDDKKMTGAVVNAGSYLKLFEKINKRFLKQWR